MKRIRNFMSRGSNKTPLSAILCYMAILALLFTSVSFSKFAVATSVSDESRVAGFAARAVFDEPTDPLEVNDLDVLSTDFFFTVYNNVSDLSGAFVSEVAQKYDIIIVLPKKLPDKVTLTLDDVEADDVSSDGKTYTFFDVGTFEPAVEGVEDDHKHQLTFTCEASGLTADSTYEDIEVRVHVEQID